MLQSYYREFGTSWWDRVKAKVAYSFLKTDYKIMAELNGKILIGAHRYAELIALGILYSQLRLKTVDEKIQVLEGMYFLEKNKHHPAMNVRNRQGKLEMLEILCKPYILSKVRDGKVRI